MTGAGLPERIRLASGSPALKERIATAILTAAGRPVRCELCSRELFRGLPVVWRGRLKLLGAERAFVRVDWDKTNRLVFQHVEAERCREDSR